MVYKAYNIFYFETNTYTSKYNIGVKNCYAYMDAYKYKKKKKFSDKVYYIYFHNYKSGVNDKLMLLQILKK